MISASNESYHGADCGSSLQAADIYLPAAHVQVVGSSHLTAGKAYAPTTAYDNAPMIVPTRPAEDLNCAYEVHFECPDCGRRFDKPHGLTIHRARFCGTTAAAKPRASYRAAQQNMMHAPLPNADGRFECSDCGRLFDTAHGVTIHRHTCDGRGDMRGRS